ncbi:hypothetical protein LTR37_005112 [Vermiconidia calcicola]|uniref:Uncharacterized protein n=1 Tax=Vermiconidia calcicola TaxID=1690605 RepID=A0ACC3NMQ4_9PEZI|nr:hypothetical protein LTR37_005112 [Vermiconidia calcicola]
MQSTQEKLDALKDLLQLLATGVDKGANAIAQKTMIMGCLNLVEEAQVEVPRASIEQEQQQDQQQQQQMPNGYVACSGPSLDGVDGYVEADMSSEEGGWGNEDETYNYEHHCYFCHQGEYGSCRFDK